jgi:hypothetical protein
MQTTNGKDVWDEVRPAGVQADDVFWSEYRKRTMAGRYVEYTAARERLQLAGIDYLYGGTKGHGFWLDGPKADDGETGNPFFWSIAEVNRRLDAEAKQ